MKIIFALLVLFSFSAHASVCENKGPNVILLTLDGVRSYEFFHGTGLFHAHQLKKKERGEIFTTFWSHYADEGTVLGGGNRYRIGSDIAISLPSYQAMMVGHPTPCRKNNCDAINEKSVLEQVRASLHLPKKDVAVFASWNRVVAAAAQDPTFITNGVYPAVVEEDARLIEIQQQALTDLPHWAGARKDKYTFELGMHYLQTYCPRLLYISLLDSDEFAHEGDYPNYVRSLRTYDQYIDQLIQSLDQMGEYGKATTLIITTDHSRGAGPFWTGHANTKSSEKKVFLYARGRGVEKTGRSRKKASHLNIKPTIEYLLGIKPTGKILPNIQVD